MAYIPNRCADTLHQYLGARPFLLIDGQRPLSFTDYGQRWNRTALSRMFAIYRKKAGIEKKGGLYVFARHSPATSLIRRGCDIRIVKEIIRHNDISTTMRL